MYAAHTGSLKGTICALMAAQIGTSVRHLCTVVLCGILYCAVWWLILDSRTLQQNRCKMSKHSTKDTSAVPAMGSSAQQVRRQQGLLRASASSSHYPTDAPQADVACQVWTPPTGCQGWYPADEAAAAA